MDERSFDALLRLALMEANLERFREALDQAGETAFSPAYLRHRTRLLADPFGYAKRAARPIWKKTLQSAACVLLACTVTLGALMAVSPTVRAAVLHWLREISGNSITYTTGSRAEGEALPSNWRITWLPEGWQFKYMTRNHQSYQEANGPGSLLLGGYMPDAARLATSVDDVADAASVRSTVQILGYSADYYQSEKYRVLVWEDADGYLFLLRGGFLEEADFLKIAESITFYTGPDTAYGMGWVPPEYEPMYRDELIGAAEEAWTYHGITLLWQYVTDPICPLAEPEGEPEEVTVGGLPARYWAGGEQEAKDGEGFFSADGEPMEIEGSTVVVGDVSITVSGSADQPGILMWMDPETNTAFRLEGDLGRGDLLRMAESVTKKAPEPSEPSGNTMVTSGTAYGG